MSSNWGGVNGTEKNDQVIAVKEKWKLLKMTQPLILQQEINVTL